MNLLNVLFIQKNDLKEFKDALETLYYYTKEIKPNNEVQEKDLEKRKVVINVASKLFDKLLNTYKAQYNKLSEG